MTLLEHSVDRQAFRANFHDYQTAIASSLPPSFPFRFNPPHIISKAAAATIHRTTVLARLLFLQLALTPTPFRPIASVDVNARKMARVYADVCRPHHPRPLDFLSGFDFRSLISIFDLRFRRLSISIFDFSAVIESSD